MDVRQVAAVAIAILGLGALAACSGRPEAGSPAAVPAAGRSASRPASPATSAVVKSPYCEQAPSSMVGSALRLSLGKQVTSVDGPVSVCAYTGKYEVVLRFQVGENASEFSQSRTSLVGLHQSVRGVARLGDQAYFAKYGSGLRASNTLAARKGAVAVFVTAPTRLAIERSLMAQLLARV